MLCYEKKNDSIIMSKTSIYVAIVILWDLV